MLKVNLQLRRRGFAPPFTLDAAFEQSARVTGVFGPSGAGKSTLMHLIAGLESPDRGRIELDGDTLFDSRERINVPPHKRRIGVMFQDDRLFPHYSVEGNLRYGAAHAAAAPRRGSAALSFDEVVTLLALRELLPRSITTLSGGERQRVALGRALLSNPRLLLLDEPLSSLDAGLKRQILPYLDRVRDAAGIPMLYVSHDLTEMLQITDYLLLLERGQVVAHGSFNALAHDHAALESLHEHGLLNVLHVSRTGVDTSAGVVMLELDGRGVSGAKATLRAAIADVSERAAFNVAIRASDIALAAQRIEGVSIQNQLHGAVTRVTRHGGRAVVEVDVGRALFAEVTLRAVESLRIEPGRTMWCLIKSNAIRAA